MSIFGASTTPGAGLFGNAGAQQSTAGNMFGSTNPQAQPTGAAAQFGSTPQNQPGQQQQQQQPQQPSIFGASATNAQGAAGGAGAGTGTGAGMFGSFGQSTAGIGGSTGAGTGAGAGTTNPFGNLGGTTNAHQGATATPGAGLFSSLSTGQTQPGATSGTAGTGAGLFGNPQPGAASGGGATAGIGAGLFVNPAGGAGGFGVAGPTSTSQQAAAPGPGLFGAGGTSNMFGASTATNPTSSTGQTPAQPQQQGLFGNTNSGAGAAGSGAAAPSFGPSLFGASTSNPAGAGLFGGTSAAAGTKPAGSNLFGLSTNTTPGTGPGFGSLFPMAGAATAAAPQSQLQKSTLYGSALGTSALGGSSLLPSAAQTRSLQNQTDAHLQFMKLVQQIQLVKEFWEPTSPLCRFRHIFYNLVDPSQISRYERPANVAPELWEKGVKENPDPTCLVPVVANGFDDLRERVKGQTDSAAKQEAVFKELKTRLDSLQEKHSTNNLSRLQRAQYQQTRITQRMLAFIQHLHLLIPAVRSSAMRPEEEVLRTRLEDIEEEMRKGRIKEKLNELWALTGAVYAHRRSIPDSTNNEWTVVDDDGMAQLVAILSEQQAGLAHLTKVLQKDLKDLAIIMGAKEPAPEKVDESAMDEDLWSSTTSLRVSALR